MNRRTFIQKTSATGTVLTLGLYFGNHEIGIAKTSPDDTTDVEILPFVRIDIGGNITLINPRPDMGQGSYQAMALLLAEELDVPFPAVKIVPSDGSPKYGSQLSGGTSSVRGLWIPLRTAGAAAREMLTRAAALLWDVPEKDCIAQQGFIVHRPTARSVPYKDLITRAVRLEVPKQPTLKSPQDFKLIGKYTPRPDVPDKVQGKTIFGIDVKVPGMLYASIERPPMIVGKVAQLDDTAARAVKGVKKVLKSTRPLFMRTAETVAVIADNYYAALQGRKALKITWDGGEAAKFNSKDYYPALASAAQEASFAISEQRGNFEQAFAQGAQKFTANYETPFAAHASMEPECVVAHWIDTPNAPYQLEVWVPTQGPDWLLNDLNRAFGIPKEKIKVNVTFLGGAFGRKAYHDFVQEAIQLSREMKAPIKLIWTREDDLSQGPFRPGMLNRLEGALDAQGNLTALRHKVVGQSIKAQFGGLKAGEADDWAIDGISTEDSPYSVPNFQMGFKHVENTVPVMWWRSVYASTNMFGHECFIDELAHAAGKNPLDFRLTLLKDHPRFVKVLQMVAEKSDWNTPLLKGSGRGIAIARSFASICAQVVEVVPDAEGGLKVKKVTAVIDCGIAVNPDNVKAQTEGNIIMALGVAVKDSVSFVNGEAQERNFDTYRMIRLHETPEIEVFIVPSAEAPGGVGEPGLPPFAPAFANAIFAATGKRIRRLPLDLREI